MTKYLFFFLVSTGISLVITPLIRLLAKKANICDIPSERKIHRKSMPLLGGVPIFISLNLTLLLGFILNNTYIKELLLSRWRLLLACQIIILTMGIYDDIKKIQPRIKFLFQISVGIILILFGFGIHTISNPFSGNVIHLGLFSIPVTILWLVGITNALNLVDGLDGLAAGTSLIVCATIFAISYFNQNIGIGLVSLILAGSILGFLRYNFYPAKIFLGDSGSLLLGFLLAVLSIEGSSKGATLVAVLAPILALGLPIMDTLLSMIRRFSKSIDLVNYRAKNGRLKAAISNGISMFEADKDHIHHRLLKLGFSHKKAVIVLYSICVGLCIVAFLTVAWANFNITLFLFAILVSVFIGIKSLNYRELKVLESGILLPLFKFPIIDKKLFQAFFDLLVISFSYYLSFILVLRNFGGLEKTLFIKTLPFVLALKIIIFYISGLYKSSWRYSSIHDIIKIIKALVLSSVCSIFVLVLIFGMKTFGGIIFFIMDFYLLLSFVAGYRVSFRILDSFYHRNSADNGKKILIYGAGNKGSTVLKEIRRNGSYFFSPVGFIDDDIDKKGKILHSYPIFGSIEDLERVVNKNEISEIIISTRKIGKEKMKKLKEFCKQKGITMRQFEFRLDEIS